jgi:CheY-like chemotaxis protein
VKLEPAFSKGALVAQSGVPGPGGRIDLLRRFGLFPAGGRPCHDFKSVCQSPCEPVVFAVDDNEHVAELYSILLDAAGYCMEVFTNRTEALTELKARATSPDLLITGYRGSLMSADQFIRDCIAVHPPLRILMATGFHQTLLHRGCAVYSKTIYAA